MSAVGPPGVGPAQAGSRELPVSSSGTAATRDADGTVGGQAVLLDEPGLANVSHLYVDVVGGCPAVPSANCCFAHWREAGGAVLHGRGWGAANNSWLYKRVTGPGWCCMALGEPLICTQTGRSRQRAGQSSLSRGLG